MPIALVRSYLALMPRPAAEETLDAATAVSLGTGAGPAVERVRRNLMRVAAGKPRRAVRQPHPHALAAMGIKAVKSDA